MHLKKMYNRYNLNILFSSILTIGLFAAVAGAECLSYEPDMVAVSGIIRTETFPGPPNYEAVAKGDSPEIFWILVLDKPVCVEAGQNDALNESESEITEMQMILDSKQYSVFRQYLSLRVMVKGTLFHAHTGHHHTRVLIRVKEIEKVA